VSFLITQPHIVGQIDTDQWVNFLILAIMAILWLFGTLIKAAGKRKPPQARPGGLAREQRESWQQWLARKAEEMQRAAEGPRREAAERTRRLEEKAGLREQVQERPPGKITVRSGRGGESVLVYEQAEPAADSTQEQHAARQREAKQAVAAAGRKTYMAPAEPRREMTTPDLTPATGDLPEMMQRAPETLKPAEEGLDAQRESAVGYEPASIIDCNDPGALKKAVLHYEILGKPVGLRDLPEYSAGF